MLSSRSFLPLRNVCPRVPSITNLRLIDGVYPHGVSLPSFFALFPIEILPLFSLSIIATLSLYPPATNFPPCFYLFFCISRVHTKKLVPSFPRLFHGIQRRGSQTIANLSDHEPVQIQQTLFFDVNSLCIQQLRFPLRCIPLKATSI